MNAAVLNAFLDAASVSLRRETRGPIRRIGLQMDPSELVTDEVTVYLSMVGSLRGLLLVSMSASTAQIIAENMVGEPQPKLTDMGLSAIAELGNLIAGRSCIELEKLGIVTDITPPTLMMGQRSRLSMLGLPRFVIPLRTQSGNVNVHVAVHTGV
jgi:chemotaxis protein CheX